MPALKCGTQQAAALPCGAGMVSTERSCWACGGVGHLAYGAPRIEGRRGAGKGKTPEPRASAFSHINLSDNRGGEGGGMNVKVGESK